MITTVAVVSYITHGFQIMSLSQSGIQRASSPKKRRAPPPPRPCPLPQASLLTAHGTDVQQAVAEFKT